MKRTDLYALLSHVATGVSLFVMAAGAMWGFIFYLKLSLFSAVAAAVIGLVPGLFLLLFSEGVHLLIRLLEEKQTQTGLLKEIRDQLERPSSDA